MEINKDDLDRIVITSNEQMQKIIDWYLSNEEVIQEITGGGIEMPIHDGLIWFKEECIQAEFHNPEGNCKFVVYMEADPKKYPTVGYVKMYTFEVNLNSHDKQDDYVIKNFIVDTNHMDCPQSEINKRIKTIIDLSKADRTAEKIAYKLAMTLFFMALAEEIVEIDHSQDQPRTRRVARAMKIRNQPLNLVRKTYVIKNFDPKKTKIKGAPRRWTAPDHEVSVRGHYRHLQSGKVIWIRECTKFKEKGNRKPKEWKM